MVPNSDQQGTRLWKIGFDWPRNSMSALYIRLLSLYRHGWASLPARSGCGSQKVLGFGAERIEDGEGDKVGQLQKQKDLYDMFDFS